MSRRSQQWHPNPSMISIGNGAKVNIYLLRGKYYRATIEEVKSRLAKKWGTSALKDPELEELRRELAQQGYNLPEIAARLGDNRDSLTQTQQADLTYKKLGDLAEILAQMVQEEIRAIPEEDFFTPLQRKVTIAVSEHGTDYIAFRFDATHLNPLPNEHELIVLGESKHTSSTSDLKTACRETRSWILERLTRCRLYAELTNISEEYRRHGEEWKRIRALGFIPSIYIRDEKLIISATMLYADSISDVKAVSDLETDLLVALDSHREGPIPHARLEALLFKAADIQGFCNSCYEVF